MDPRALELLELPEILERLAAVAASEPGKHRCLALEPAADVDEVERRQALTTETVRLLEESAEPELAEVRDVRHAVEVAARGSTLDTGTLWAIAVSIDAAIAARWRTTGRICGTAPRPLSGGFAASCGRAAAGSQSGSERSPATRRCASTS